jgi:hypothetical protein
VVVTEIKDSSIALTYQVKGTLRWTAPELLEICEPKNDVEDAPKIFPTAHCDIYSFAGIMLYVRICYTLSCDPVGCEDDADEVVAYPCALLFDRS